jgi:hypothetical protein
MPDPATLIDRFIDAATVRYTRLSVIQTHVERFGSRMGPSSRLLLKYDGRRIYIKALEGPRAGSEIIYAPGWNGNKARVRTGGFPDVTINLDPRGKLMMQGQHHSIEHASFAFLARTLAISLARGRVVEGFSAHYLGERQVEGRSAECVSLRCPWKVERHLVAPGEDAWSLAEQLAIPPRLLLQVNGFSKLSDVRPGRWITTPAYYGTGIDIALDKETLLPLRMTVYESAGVPYEDYAWSDIDLVTPITDIDFSPDNPAYGFRSGLLERITA